VPAAPRKPCRKPGCKTLTLGSFCEAHTVQRETVQREQRIRYDNERGTATERGYNSKWARYSKQYRLENPLCAICEKAEKLVLAQCVDHIVPVTGPDDPLFWEPTNHQGLCNTCHSIKTATEDCGFGNERKNNGRIG